MLRIFDESKSKIERLADTFSHLFSASPAAGETFKKPRFSGLFCISMARPLTPAVMRVPLLLGLRREFLDSGQPARATMDFGGRLRLESRIIMLARRGRRQRRRA